MRPIELQQDITPLKRQKSETSFLKRVVMASWVVLFATAVYQIIFFPEIVNLIAISAVVLAWAIVTNIWLTKKMLERYLLSTFMILGFASSQFYFPLLFTTIENKPLIYNLELPEQVFLHSSLALLVLAIAHASYRFLMRASPDRPLSVLDKAGFFQAPAYLQLWIMGFVGMASSFYVHFASPEIGQEVTGAAGDKIVQALVPFMYAPFFIPLGKLYGNHNKIPRSSLPLILAYSVLLFAISLARNSRSAFIFGLTTPAFAYVLGLLLGVFKTKIMTARNVILGGSVIFLLTGPLGDLGIAMLIVRGDAERVQDIPPAELITLTLEALDDEVAIERRREEDRGASMDADWDERYLDNLFTARFSNIKFNDSNLITYSRVGDFDPDMQEYTLDQLIAALPDPVIKLFDFDVDKEGTLLMSFGDYLYILSGGNGTPQGLRIGHIAGTGMSTFGWWYLFLLGAVMIPVFYLIDKFFRPVKKVDEQVVEESESRFKLSFCGVLVLTFLFQFFGIESVVFGATFLIRGWIQMVLLYFVIFHITRVIAGIFTSKRKRLRFSPAPNPI
ncbi:MAG: hypothetical protein WKF87_00530 [Chryseolinea sp.]